MEPFLGSIVITVEAFWTETLSDTLTVHDQLSAALTKSFLTRSVQKPLPLLKMDGSI